MCVWRSAMETVINQLDGIFPLKKNKRLHCRRIVAQCCVTRFVADWLKAYPIGSRGMVSAPWKWRMKGRFQTRFDWSGDTRLPVRPQNRGCSSRVPDGVRYLDVRDITDWIWGMTCNYWCQSQTIRLNPSLRRTIWPYWPYYGHPSTSIFILSNRPSVVIGAFPEQLDNGKGCLQFKNPFFFLPQKTIFLMYPSVLWSGLFLCYWSASHAPFMAIIFY